MLTCVYTLNGINIYNKIIKPIIYFNHAITNDKCDILFKAKYDCR